MPDQLFHTVLDLDLSGDDLYARHQKIAAFLSADADASRDFQFAVQGDQVYLRAPQPRRDTQGWRPMAMPEAGKSYTASGTVWIDASRLTASERPIWRLPQIMASIVARMLGRAGNVRSMTVNPHTGLPLSKPGQRPLIITPVAFAAALDVQDAAAAAHVAAKGIGRGKGFGFGCVFFQGA
jgi:hypothetical protein